MGKINYSMNHLSTKLYRETSKGRTIDGKVRLISQSDRSGGVNVTREYCFDRYQAREQCHYDRDEMAEFEKSGLIDALQWFSKQFLKENMVIRLKENWTNTEGNISVRKSEPGKDYCIKK